MSVWCKLGKHKEFTVDGVRACFRCEKILSGDKKAIELAIQSVEEKIKNLKEALHEHLSDDEAWSGPFGSMYGLATESTIIASRHRQERILDILKKA